MFEARYNRTKKKEQQRARNFHPSARFQFFSLFCYCSECLWVLCFSFFRRTLELKWRCGRQRCSGRRGRGHRDDFVGRCFRRRGYLFISKLMCAVPAGGEQYVNLWLMSLIFRFWCFCTKTLYSFSNTTVARAWRTLTLFWITMVLSWGISDWFIGSVTWRQDILLLVHGAGSEHWWGGDWFLLVFERLFTLERRSYRWWEVISISVGANLEKFGLGKLRPFPNTIKKFERNSSRFGNFHACAVHMLCSMKLSVGVR